ERIARGAALKGIADTPSQEPVQDRDMRALYYIEVSAHYRPGCRIARSQCKFELTQNARRVRERKVKAKNLRQPAWQLHVCNETPAALDLPQSPHQRLEYLRAPRTGFEREFYRRI